jgi:hypothetical protein
MRTPGEILVDEEERRLRGIAVDMGMDDEIVGIVACGDKPFLAREIEFAAASVGPGLDETRIGAGA